MVVVVVAMVVVAVAMVAVATTTTTTTTTTTATATAATTPTTLDATVEGNQQRLTSATSYIAGPTVSIRPTTVANAPTNSLVTKLRHLYQLDD